MKISYIGQTFGNRVVIKDKCDKEDWEKVGIKIPSEPSKYKLTRCLNCGAYIPCSLTNLKKYAPKKCVFCSNIGNHSKVETNTNSWTEYEEYAVCNIKYKNEIISAYIDMEDANVAKQYVWRVVKKRQKYYAITGSFKKGTAVYMHHLFASRQLNDGEEIDHVDGNSLNNMRKNLRVVSRQGNIDNQIATRIDNQIGIRGVCYDRRGKKYKVDFSYHKQRFYTVGWDTVEEAVWCRKCFEDHFGIPSIKNNPLAEQYYTLPYQRRKEIHDYVLSIILGNKR